MSKLNMTTKFTLFTTPAALREMADNAEMRWCEAEPGGSLMFATLYGEHCELEMVVDQQAMREIERQKQKEVSQ